MTSNKSVGESVTPEQPSGDIRAEASGSQTNGWYTGDVAVTISGAPGISYSLDEAPFTPGTSLTVNGTGVHFLDSQGSDGSHGSLAVPVDASNPTVTVNATYGFGQVAHAVCADSGSGIASCSPTAALDTNSVGLHENIPAHAEDRAGHSFTGTLTYNVTAYPFTGFFSPVDNLPVINIASAGSSVPIKFSLSGFRGLNVLAPGSPSSQPMACGGGVSDPIEETGLPGSTSFSYDPVLDRSKYVWKTERSWRNTCRQLIVRLRDGTEKRVYFKFK